MFHIVTFQKKRDSRNISYQYVINRPHAIMNTDESVYIVYIIYVFMYNVKCIYNI